MSGPNNLTNPDSLDPEKTAALKNTDPTALPAQLMKEENVINANTANAEGVGKESEADKGLLERVKVGERWMIGITILIFFVSAFQAYESWINNESTGKQVSSIIIAADRIDDAADSFSRSAAGIDHGISDAVTELKHQTRASREFASQAKKQSAEDRRPYIDSASGVSDEPRMYANPNLSDGLVQIVWNWNITNYGKTPSAHMIPHAEMKLGSEPFAGSYDGHGQQIGKSAEAFGSGWSQAPTKTSFDTVFSRPMTAGEAQDYLHSSDGITIRIRITYSDLDGNRYESLICFQKQPVGALAYCHGYVR